MLDDNDQISYKNVTEIKEWFTENVFLLVENCIDCNVAAIESGNMHPILTSKEYAAAYTEVYKCCSIKYTREIGRTFETDLLDLIKSHAARVGDKYPPHSRHFCMYIAIIGHIFKHIDRFYMTRLGLPSMKEFITAHVVAGRPRARAMRRWRLVRSRILRLERHAKITSRVDLWLVKNDLVDLMDAKCKVPCFRPPRQRAVAEQAATEKKGGIENLEKKI